MPNHLSRFKALLKYVTTAIILYFLFIYVKKTTAGLNFTEMKHAVIHEYLVASLALSIIYVFNYSLIWQYITKKLCCSLPLVETLKVRFYSEFCKYVPGKALSVATILYFYDKKGVSKTRVTVCLAFEAILTVMSSVLVFLVCFSFSTVHIDYKYKILAGVSASILFFFIHPVVFNYLLKLFFTLTKKPPTTLSFGYVTIIEILFMYSLNWVLGGSSFYYLVKALHPVTDEHFLSINGINAFSGFIGFVSVITPAGIGVREASIVYLLSALLPMGVSSMSSVISRFWLLSAELFLLVLMLCYLLVKRMYFSRK